MYSFEDAERIARSANQRESVKIYLMDKIVESLRILADSNDSESEQYKIDKISEGLIAISNGLFDIKDTNKELSEIRLAIHDLVDEVGALNEVVENISAEKKENNRK